MSIPTIPLLTSNPIGWAVLGTAGYLVYRSGKKAGTKAEEQIERAPLHDRVVKGTMKCAYKAKMKVDESLSDTRAKYSTMWSDARDEVTAKA